jgi:hypothetical protein
LLRPGPPIRKRIQARERRFHGGARLVEIPPRIGREPRHALFDGQGLHVLGHHACLLLPQRVSYALSYVHRPSICFHVHVSLT